MEGDPRGKADTCVQVNCPPSPLARFLVPFFRAEKRNCPPHRRKGFVRRGVGASKERRKSSLCRLRKFIVCAHAASGQLFFLLFHGLFFDDPALSGESEIFSFFSLRSCRAAVTFCCSTKSNQKGNQGGQALRASACPPWNPHHTTTFSAVVTTNPPVTS